MNGDYELAKRLRAQADQSGSAELYRLAAMKFEESDALSAAAACLRRAEAIEARQ
jgi:hypothetical protein